MSRIDVHDERITALGLFLEVHAGLIRAMERDLETAAGMPLPWFGVLLRLARSPDQRLRMCDLATQVGLTPSGLTRVVDRLVEAGLVERVGSAKDRRVSHAVLTPAGRRAVEAVLPLHLDQIERHFTGALPPGELRQFLAALRVLRDHVHPGAAAGATDPAPAPTPAPALSPGAARR